MIACSLRRRDYLVQIDIYPCEIHVFHVTRAIASSSRVLSRLCLMLGGHESCLAGADELCTAGNTAEEVSEQSDDAR